jgi:hypothetical protein
MKQILFVTILFRLAGVNCLAAEPIWQATSGDVEFSITSDISGVSVVSPNTLQTGYDGAWVFGQSSHKGVAQTFTVGSARTLKSATLRLAGFDFHQPSGQVEIAVFQFNTASQSPSNKLGSFLVNAEDYFFSLQNAPRSTFNFSSFGIVLNPENTYALAAIASDMFVGKMTLQGTADIYSGGSTYNLNLAIPEPNSVTLALICSIASIWRRSTRRAYRNSRPTVRSATS